MDVWISLSEVWAETSSKTARSSKKNAMDETAKTAVEICLSTKSNAMRRSDVELNICEHI